MFTLIFTYRNRDINIVKNSLDSLKGQSNKGFNVILVNYGSNENYSRLINDLVNHYNFTRIINCGTQGELWCKSKAINIALKQCDTPFVFIGDVDMVFHPEFVQKLDSFKKEKKATYFQVGFLNQEESSVQKPFYNYTINFKSTGEVTGMTLYNLADLLEINGYDEFYHGWGAEDSDVHRRLEHNGIDVNFYNREVLMLHQWHEKDYRSNFSSEPFHSNLEKINHKYYTQTIESKKVRANMRFDWGKIITKSDLSKNNIFKLTNERNEIEAFLNGLFLENETTFSILISSHPEEGTIKNSLKKFLGKKHKEFYSFSDLNNMILMQLITNFRNNYYEYKWDKLKETIHLKISL